MRARRFILAAAVALVVCGWEATHYADLQQQMLPEGDERMKAWHGKSRKAKKFNLPAGRTIYAAGVLSMAVGAGMFGFAYPRGGGP